MLTNLHHFRNHLTIILLFGISLLPLSIAHPARAEDLPRLLGSSSKILEKRPNHPYTRNCNRDYSYPNYNNCRLAIVQLPTWSSFDPVPNPDAACKVTRVFREGRAEVPGIENVQLPLRRSFGTCTVLVSGVHSFEELEGNDNVGLAPSDYDNWWSIIDAAYQINSHCVGIPGIGGQQLAGESKGIQVALYGQENSPVERAVNRWLGAYPTMIGQTQPNDNLPSTTPQNTQTSKGQDGSPEGTEGSSTESNKLAVYCVPGMGRDCIIGMVCKPLPKISKVLIGIAMTIIEIGICSLEVAVNM
ncbi:MAG: hypothetical protein M1812_006459 [Candelaria pacifica]|nr:MAG: hypothetical protein M1812_006459 [Candelaria pacifica]